MCPQAAGKSFRTRFTVPGLQYHRQQFTPVGSDWANLMLHKPRLTEDWWNLQFFMPTLGEFGKSDLFQ